MKKSIFNIIKKVSKKNVLPAINRTVLIDSTGITATDFETWYKIALPEGWQVTGAGVVSLDILQDTAGANSIRIDFETSAGVFTIDGRAFRSGIIAANDFPLLPDTINKYPNGHIIAKDVAGVLDFLGKNQLYPAMLGAYIGEDIVGTNGHMLRYIKTDYEGAPFILTRAGVEIIKASLKDVETWTVEQDEFNVCLTCPGGGRIIARKIQETYPAYKNVIPQNNSGLITLNKNILESTLKSLTNFVDKNTNLVELKTIDAGGVAVKGFDIFRQTESTQEIPAGVEGLPSAFRIGFNLKYLQTACSNIAGDSFSMQLSTPTRAGVVNDEILIMPVMLSQ